MVFISLSYFTPNGGVKICTVGIGRFKSDNHADHVHEGMMNNGLYSGNKWAGIRKIYSLKTTFNFFSEYIYIQFTTRFMFGCFVCCIRNM
jgi:hypothetical protein